MWVAHTTKIKHGLNHGISNTWRCSAEKVLSEKVRKICRITPCQNLFCNETASKVSVFEVFLVRIFLHPDRIRENKDQKNSEYGHFLRNESCRMKSFFKKYLRSAATENKAVFREI